MLASTVCWYFYVPFRPYAPSLNVLLFSNTFLGVFLLCRDNYLCRKYAKCIVALKFYFCRSDVFIIFFFFNCSTLFCIFAASKDCMELRKSVFSPGMKYDTYLFSSIRKGTRFLDFSMYLYSYSAAVIFFKINTSIYFT
jgi:hypothetical protein